VVTKTTENYPNDDPERKTTIDASEQLAQIRAKKAKWLETKEIKAPAYTPQKGDVSADGNREAQSVDSEYPIAEARKQMGRKSGTPSPTPVIEDEDGE
jgi:hypothetical protein